MTNTQREIVELARRVGFTSAALFPAHGGGGRAYASVMCLGHSVSGFFDHTAFGALRVSARTVALELHDWRIRQMRERLLRQARLSATEIRLLEHEYQGRGTKQIAAEMRVSGSSINSRFQRLNARLRVPNRRMAAKLAVECGLITG